MISNSRLTLWILIMSGKRIGWACQLWGVGYKWNNLPTTCCHEHLLPVFLKQLFFPIPIRAINASPMPLVIYIHILRNPNFSPNIPTMKKARHEMFLSFFICNQKIRTIAYSYPYDLMILLKGSATFEIFSLACTVNFFMILLCANVTRNLALRLRSKFFTTFW